MQMLTRNLTTVFVYNVHTVANNWVPVLEACSFSYYYKVIARNIILSPAPFPTVEIISRIKGWNRI
jgi:hypothetical protein